MPFSRATLRRLLWLLPTLFVVTVPIFWALSRATPAARGDTRALFFDADPPDVRKRALQAMSLAASGDARGSAVLLELGGAALPHVLPRLDSLSPAGRGRVARSLSPLASRMGIGLSSDLDSDASAVVFWGSFWAEHSIDFRPVVVDRAVRRLRERASAPRRTEVRQLDTYALGDLVARMRPVETPGDVEKVRALCEMAAHAAGRGETVPPGASVESAILVVESWEEYWLQNRSRFVAFDGARRLLAMLLETRYGQWAERFVTRGLGRSRDGVSIAAQVRERGPLTLALVGAGLLGGYALALGWALAFALGPPGARIAARALWLSLLGGTGVGLSAMLAIAMLRSEGLVPALVMAVATGALAARRFEVLLERLLTRPFWVTERAFAVPLRRTALHLAKVGAPSAIAIALSDLPSLLTSSFVVERMFSLRGLGELTVEATRTSDLSWLMALAAIGTLTVGAAQIVADRLLGAVDPRPIPPAVREGLSS